MDSRYTKDQLSKILNHRFWRCGNCDSVHRGLGRIYTNSNGDLCCDCCHTALTEDIIKEVKR